MKLQPTRSDGEILWRPGAETVEGTRIGAYLRWLERHRDLRFEDYGGLWRWSVTDLTSFWSSIWQFFGIQADSPASEILTTREMPGAKWFPGARLNYARHALRGPRGETVLIALSQTRPHIELSRGELADEVARVRAGLRRLGVGEGDRVAAYLPSLPETVVAFLASASLGALWTACPPEFGVSSVVDRLGQIEPKVLIAVDGYRYGDRDVDRLGDVERLRSALPSVEQLVFLPYLDAEARPPAGAVTWAELRAEEGPLEFTEVDFDHPLWVLFSSGTTGPPKGIVHGHGGILLEHLKNFRLHHDVRPGDRVLWFTTTGWIMWNYLTSGLLADVSIVLYDGNPGHPELGVLWDLAAQARATLFGCGAAFIHSCIKAGIRPAEGRDLSALRAIGSTGSPLAPEAFDWIYSELGDDIWLASVSGGTDIAGAFIGGAPIVPVYRGELPARYLGVDVQAWDEDGNAVIDDVGELVVTQPMPSMPVRFWNDPGHERYTEAYFSTYPGVWRHGDWVRVTPRGSAVIHGRSDSTINRGGIRIGTAEIYSAVLDVDEIADALAVDVPSEDGTGDGFLYLFVVLAERARLTDEVRASLRARIRRDCSPRHVPDEVVVVPDIPRTLTGKLVEVPVKKLLMGRDAAGAASRDTLANPAAFDWFVEFARERAATGAAG
jgi:acetoacetyl-CoA synthetase